MLDNTNITKSSEIEIDISDIIRNLAKNIWMILLFGLTTAMLAYVFSNAFYKPTYESSTTFVVTSKGYNNIYTNLAAANTVAQTMTGIFSSDILEKKIAKDLGMDSLPAKIEAKVIDETNLFVLTVNASSPDQAFQIMNAIISNYATVTSNVFGNAILSVLEAPELPLHPNNKINIMLIIQLAFIAGLAAMTALLTGVSILRDDIKNDSELIRKLNTKLFGVIYHESKYKTISSRLRKKKKSILVTSPTVSFAFLESIKKIRAKFEYKASRLGHNVLLVTSTLENEGKSTIATNLAIALAKKDLKVLLIDADFYNPSIYKILNKEVGGEQEVEECMTKLSDLKNALVYDENSGLHLLFGTRLYKNSTDLVTEDSFMRLIHKAKKIMDYIIIDSPPVTTSADAEILADVADVSLLVVRQSTALTKDIQEAINVLTASKSELLGCVYNNVHKHMSEYRLSYGSQYSYKHYYGLYGKRVSNQES